jgi:LCP family protein required for cell wall assembly
MRNPRQRGATRTHPPLARHGRLHSHPAWRAVLGTLSIACAVLVVSAVSLTGIVLLNLERSIESVPLVGETPGPPPSLGSFEGGFNVLVVGSDVCEDDSGCNGRGKAELNDVTILIHVAEDQQSAVAVSFPRDMVVPIPACPRKDGNGFHSAMSAQPINNTLAYGGLACAVLTVSELTGLDIPFALLVKFEGLKKITEVIGGVPVCVDGPIDDRWSGFKVDAAGTYPLSGENALNFLRTRHGVGDGSDLGRISTQQMFLSSMLRTLKKPDGVLNDPLALFRLATVVSDNTTFSNSLRNPMTMVSMARVLNGLGLENIAFAQYPSVYGQDGIYSGKVAPVVAEAERLMDKIRADERFVPGKTGLGTSATDAPGTGEVTSPPSNTSPANAPEVLDGVQGQTAADETCARHF